MGQPAPNLPVSLPSLGLTQAPGGLSWCFLQASPVFSILDAELRMRQNRTFHYLWSIVASCAGKSRLETSALRAGQWAGCGDESGRLAPARRWPFPAGPGACAGRGWSPAQLGPERKNQAWVARPWPERPDADPGVGAPGARGPRGGGRGRPRALAPHVHPPEAHGRRLPAASAAPCGAGGVRGPLRRPGAPPSRVGIPRAVLGERPGARGQRRRRTRPAGGTARQTMRPAQNRAARVGPAGARVAECVCVRLPINADRPRPIGRAPPASPPTATAHWARLPPAPRPTGDLLAVVSQCSASRLRQPGCQGLKGIVTGETASLRMARGSGEQEE
ncbi:collagen alpha-1(I) chain-like [Lutra lutra]|uniref:collagen alpha-1(I) chain-like n=1 Tax=Lutra lutra TaxID=9657 RepID=UPI001FD5B539|nr:collagen alpha-1(I) chain-like [Lutra lutra]